MNHRMALAAAFLFALPGLAIAEPPSEGPPPASEAQNEYRRNARLLMKHLYETNPAKFEALMEMRQNSPGEFRATIKQMLGEKKSGLMDPEMRAEKQKMKELREDFRSALDDYHAANRKEQSKIRGQLEELAEEIFDAKQRHRREKVTKMRTELKRLEAEIADRDASREDRIEEFVEQKIGASQPRGL